MAGGNVLIYRNWNNEDTEYISATSGTFNGIIPTLNELESSFDCNWDKSGYNFAGYNTEADGSGVTYNVGDSFPSVANLYINWIEITSITISKIQLPDGNTYDIKDESKSSATNWVNGSANGSVRTVNSVAESSSYIIGTNAVAEGVSTRANGTGSHAEGGGTQAAGDFSHAEGGGAIANGDNSHAEGGGTKAYGSTSHAEGNSTITGDSSDNTKGKYAHAEGNSTTASGEASHSEGNSTIASGNYSHAEGNGLLASGNYSHAEGTNTTASGDASHSEGGGTTASGNYSHAEGSGSRAEGYASHADGFYTIASGYASHADGSGAIANHAYQHAFGEYNIEDTSTAAATERGNYVEIVGNGTAYNKRSNARTLDWSGNEVLAGKLTVGVAGTNSLDVATIGQLPTKTSDLTNDSGFITTDSDEKLKLEEVTTNSDYRLVFGRSTAASIRQYDSNGTGYNVIMGTASTIGKAELCLGNSISSGTIGNREGRLKLYGSNNKGVTIIAGISANSNTVTLPNQTGTLALTSDIPDVSGFITSETDPVFTASAAASITSTDISNWNGKQAALVSGTNIKTINGTSLLGSGNITITGGLQNLVDGSATGSVRGIGTTAEGSNYIIGTNAVAEGVNTKASGSNSHAEGSGTTASGSGAHAEGYGTVAGGHDSHAEGGETTASGTYAHAEGYETTASDTSAHAEGNQTIASENASHAEGDRTQALGEYSHAEGSNAVARGIASHAEGYNTTASGYNTHAEGNYTRAIQSYAHAEGNNTTASGEASHAEGTNTTASGAKDHAEGYQTTASGGCAHTEGYGTAASGLDSHAEGDSTIANHLAQHVFGQYNIADTSTATTADRGNYVEIVGNGSYNARSNARTLDWSGNEVLAGKLTVGAVGVNSMDVATIGQLPTKTSDLTNDSGFITTDSDEKVRVSPTVATSSYYGMLHSLGDNDTSTKYYDLKIKYSFTNGTSESAGIACLTLGNDNNLLPYSIKGQIKLYAESQSVTIDPGIPVSGGATITLPSTSGILALASDIPTKTSDLTNDSGFITSDSDEKLRVWDIAGQSSTLGYIIIGNGTSAQIRSYDSLNFYYNLTKGTTSSGGTAELVLGNGLDDTTDKNTRGQIRLYGAKNNSTLLRTSVVDNNNTINLPNASGTIALTSDIPSKTSDLTNDSGFITSSALNNYLPLTGGSVTGPTTFGDTVSIDDLNAGQLVVNGSASVTNGINTSTVHANTLTIQKQTVGSNTYADDNPKIIFQNANASQNGSLTWTDYDSVQGPASLTLNGSQGNEYFITPNLKVDRVVNTIIKGTGTAASDKGSGTSPRYFPAKWTFNTGRAPVDGDIVVIETPVAGHDYGVFLSIDNGSHYHPITLSGTTRLTTHWPVGSYVALIFDSNNSAASMYAVAGGNSRVTVSGGTWRSLNYYSSGNTYTTAYCSTAAATAAKWASMNSYVATANRYVMVTMTATNTAASALTLNINGTGTKPIYINGSASSSSNHTLPAGSYLVFYNGTYYDFRTDGYLNAKDMSTSEVTSFVNSLDAQGANLADYVVEEGTEGNWTYRKWANGTAECWQNWASAAFAPASAVGGFYGRALTASNFPTNLFIARPAAFFNLDEWGSGYFWGQTREVTATTYRVTVWRNDNASSAAKGSMYAIGRWK